MRNINILEIDSNCYIIETKEFSDADSVVYHWDKTTQSFYGEYRMATIDKRQFQRDTFVFGDYPTIGEAVNFIWQREREMCDTKWRNICSAGRPRVIDRIEI